MYTHKDKEGRKEMFYLTKHSSLLIYRLYGVKHLVKDHSDIKTMSRCHDECCHIVDCFALDKGFRIITHKNVKINKMRTP